MSVANTVHAPPRGAVHWALWAVQLLLAAMFLMAGVMKTTTPIPELAAQLVWPGEVPASLVRFIGASELLGGLGLVLPSALRIAPRLTPAAAIGLVTIMALAAPFHVVQGHGFGPVVFNLVLAGLAAFVAWGRLVAAPIPPR
jgi:putative oxidoreductase